MKLTNTFRTQKTQCWRTPKAVYDSLNKEFRFDHDPCPPNGAFGLMEEWGQRNFVNPPYKHKKISNWLDKALIERQKGKLSVFLLPSRTGTYWFHKYAPLADEIRFIRGRLQFNNDGANAPFDSLILIFGTLSVDTYIYSVV